MQSSNRKVAILCAVVAAASMANSARAVGPDYQTLTDAPGGGAPVATLNDVAYLSGPQFIGSGTVIGDTVNAAGNVATLAILTANHVASSPGGINTIGFGANGTVLTGTVNPTNWQGYAISGQGMEDIAIMQATITKPAAPGQALNVYNSIIGNVPTLATGFSSAYDSLALTTYEMLPPPTVSVGYSQYGYGAAGVFTTNIGGAGTAGNGYLQVGDVPSGVRRFQNNTVNNITLASAVVVGGTTYYQPMVYNPVAGPSVNGGGMGMQGDSGSAYMTSAAGGNVMVTPTGNSTSQPGLGAGAVNVPLNDTNSASAVFVSVQFSGTLGTTPFGLSAPVAPFTTAIDGAVPLLATGDIDGVATGSYNWAAYYAANPALITVPEPTSLSLAVLGGAMLMRRRRKV